MKLFTILFALFIFASCNTGKNVCEKAKRKYPACFIENTIIVHDTVITPHYNTDTVFVSKKQDTLYIDKERVKVQIIRNYDTIKTNITVPADTVYITKEIKTNNPVIYKTNFFDKIPFYYYLFFVLVVGGFILFIKK